MVDNTPKTEQAINYIPAISCSFVIVFNRLLILAKVSKAQDNHDFSMVARVKTAELAKLSMW
jgi:hypothetical protein